MRTDERLNLLLPWLNKPADRVPMPEVRHRLKSFIRSFDGSLDAGFVRAEVASFARFDHAGDIVSDDIDELEEQHHLHWTLNEVLRRGFPKERHHTPPDHDGEIAPTRLLFRSERAGPKTRLDPYERKRLTNRPGAYVMHVRGSRADLVPFLVMTLLTLPGAIALARCPVEQPHSKQLCGRWFVETTGGRPRKHCFECSNTQSSTGRQRHRRRNAE